MPGIERSLGLIRRVVERSLSRDRVVKGVSADHLVLPLLASNVHIVNDRADGEMALCSARVGARTGCTRRGVYRVYVQGGVPTTNVSFPLFLALPGLLASPGLS